MDLTQPSLLRAIRNANDRQAWDLFDRTYRPLLLAWCQRSGLQAADSDEVTQSLLQRVSKEIRTFEYDPAKGRFRGWLFTLAKNEIADFRARQQRQQGRLGLLRDGLERHGAESLQPAVREHLTGNRPWRAPSGGEQASAVPEQPEENEQAWVDAFQLHLFREAFRQLRESGVLNDRAARVIERWWKDEKNGPAQARVELKLSYPREAAIRSEAVKQIAAKMLELGEDAAWLQMP
jgi:RNA polymerase sigma factor (sigma-70 family)